MTEVKPAELIIICFMLLHGFGAALNCTSPTPESLINALEADLFPKKLVRPVKSSSDTLNITIGITVVGILGVNEKAQTVTAYLWQVLEWDIEGLSWDEKQCGAKRVSIPREKLWIPDIIISEIMDEDRAPRTPYLYLYNTGHVYDDRPIRGICTCKLETYTFPFDVQNCSLTFGPYLHFGVDITMIQGTPAEEILKESRDVSRTNGEWELVNITAASSLLVLEDGSYSEIKYNIILRRRPILYVVNLLIPSCFLIILDICSFLLPPHSVDRCAFKITLILGYTVFLLLMNNLLPTTGYTTPLLNVLFSVSFALMVVSLLETILITNIHINSSQYSTVPHWIKVLVLRYIAVVVCLPPGKKSNRVTVSLHQPAGAMNTSHIPTKELESISGTEPSPLQVLALDELRKLSIHLKAIRLRMEKQFDGTKSTQEWYMVGVVLDRLLFGIYIVFILVSFITITCIWLLSNLQVE